MWCQGKGLSESSLTREMEREMVLGGESPRQAGLLYGCDLLGTQKGIYVWNLQISETAMW